MKSCEICGAEVKVTVLATVCGHRVDLCDECQRVCPQALKFCVLCEDKGN